MKALPHSLLLTSLVLVAGCSRDVAPARFAVAGQVTLDGRPLDDVMLRFVPKGKARGSSVLISDGQFTIDAAKGPTAGDFDIVVSPIAPEAEQAIRLIQAGDRDPLNAKAVPAAYQQAGRLEATVTGEGKNEFRFALTSR